MLKTIILAENALDPSTWESFEAEDVRDFLMTKFDKFPDTARIYHKHVAENCDVTPSDEWGIKRLGELEGPFYVVVYPGDPVTIIVAVVAVVAVAAAVYLLRPSVPTPSLRNTQSESPNNELSDRQNRPRPNGRIPDIFGTVRSTPDLLAVPYKIFESHEEVEYAYMCIGRGEYDVPSAEVKDDTTLISDIAGASVEVFAPFTSPNSGDDPQLRIGTAISEPLYSAVRSNAVNGQVLRAPNADSVSGNNNIRFVSPDEIQVLSSAEIDFTSFFAASDNLTISNASFTGTIPGSGVSQNVSVRFTATGTIEFETTDTTAFSVGDTLIVSGAFFTYNSGANAINLDGTYVISGKTTSVLTLSSPENINTDWNLIAGNFVDDKTDYKTCGLDVPAGQTTIDLSGTYTILSVSASLITLSNPSAVNSDWNTLANFTSGQTDYISPILSTSGSKWVGPFTLDKADLDQVFSNFVALNGLYKDDGEQQIRFDVTVELELTPVDSGGTPTGSAETFQAVIQGSDKTKSTRAVTIKANPTFTGRCEVRARRVTNADLNFEGSVIDEVKWRDVYSMSPVIENDFGDVTTVQSVTYATAGALAVKDRKLNMLVTRKIPERVSGSTFTTTKFGTNRVDEIISAICLDPKIGNRNVSEVDFDNVYNTVAEIESYFGTSDAVEFSYTFDSDNISFEETIAAIASAIYCNAYRRGSVIKLSFEKATEDSTLLFNHRNKLPGTETRTVRFGNQDDNDGVEYEWVDPEDDAIVTLYIPEDKSARNPKKIESLGVRNYRQAYFHAWRIWNKIRYQNVATEFEATQEADLLVLSDRILVADNTRPGTQDGEVISQNALSLELSQEITFDVGEDYTIFLQHTDGTVEAIPITAGASSRLVTLAHAPKAPLALDEDFYARAIYQIVGKSSQREQAFLLTEKEPQNNFTSLLRAINYSAEYYFNDELLFWLPFGIMGSDDASAFERVVTLAGSATVASDSERGLVFVGTGGYANMNLTAAASYTKAMWCNLTTDGDNGNLMSTVAIDEYLYYDGTNIGVQHYNATLGNDVVSAPYPVSAGTWVHAVATYDEATKIARIYFDGQLAVEEADFNQRANLSTLQLAAFANGTTWNGKLDDVRYYKRALTEDEVKKLYLRTRS